MARALSSLRPDRVDLLIALAILLLCGPIVHDWTAQPASRYLLTVAAVDDHSLELDPYENILGLDFAEGRGHLYTDKAPYQPLIVTPAYQLYRSVGGDPFPTVDGVRDLDHGTHYGLWWVTLWSSTVPAIVLALALRRSLRRSHPAQATAVALALVLGSTVQPFAGWLFGHVMAAMWVALAWVLLRDPDARPRALVLGGAFLGMGIGTEYAVAPIALLLLLDLAVRRRWAGGIWLSVGTVAATLPMLVYNWLVFESPFEVAYQGNLGNFEGEGMLGVYNLTGPRLEEISKALVGNRGLFVLTPVLLIAVVWCLRLLESLRWRREAALALIAFVTMVVVSTGIDGLGGASPGPRYLIPLFPLLLVPLAEAWKALPRACTAAAIVGGGTMWLASVTNPLIDTREPIAVPLWVDWLRSGDLSKNVLTGASGNWAVYVASLAAVVMMIAALAIERRARARVAVTSPSATHQPRP